MLLVYTFLKYFLSFLQAHSECNWYKIQVYYGTFVVFRHDVKRKLKEEEGNRRIFNMKDYIYTWAFDLLHISYIIWRNVFVWAINRLLICDCNYNSPPLLWEWRVRERETARWLNIVKSLKKKYKGDVTPHGI
jgi:hypothetical protein